ncbi:hypothetical protein B566_EDAN013728 [Ephemera danica]|nr:hypothetical protein B566_EDAN013728 [Ephemera danica]
MTLPGSEGQLTDSREIASLSSSCRQLSTWSQQQQQQGKPQQRRSKRSSDVQLISPPPVPSKEDAMQEPKETDEKTEPTKAEREVHSRNGSRMTNSATQTPVPEASPPPHLDGDDSTSLSSLYHGSWPVERSLWHSGPSSLGGGRVGEAANSVMSFTSSLGSPSMPEPGAPVAARRTYSQQQLGPKVEMVYGLLSMLGTHNKEEMSRTLLAMSSSPDSCIAMRQSGCLPLLVQLLHGDEAPATRQRAARALHNLVHSHPDDKRGRREARVLRLLEQVRDFCDSLQEPDMAQSGPSEDEEDPKRHPGPTVAALMKLSFDEEHRHAMCQLGGLHAVAQLIQADHEAHGSSTGDQFCVTLRRYAGMALTNLTFGDGTNKALLCSFRGFMRALVAQLSSPSEDLRQVTASVLRNLSWRADAASKQTLREVGAVTGLMQAAMEAKKESTLKSILSALWNLSAHCSMNKADICAVDGALAFLVEMLTYKSPSQTLAIIENAGGILRNISSHIAVREDYRCILRQHNCLQVLLHQLKSPSLTVVSNACGTLWNLSARCSEDQRTLWDMGAVNMLKSLVNSKHKMISMGSSAALKNLLSARPQGALGLPEMRNSQGMPVLSVRKQRALEQELDQNLAETCDNIEPSSPKTSPSHRDDKYVFAATERHFERRQRLYQSLNGHHLQNRHRVSRSESRESVTSTHSDSVYERLRAAQQHRTNRSLDLSLSDSDQVNGDISYPRKLSLREEGEKMGAVKDAFDSPEEVSMKEQTCIDDKEKSPENTIQQPSATSTPYAPRAKFQNYVFEEPEYQPVDYSLQYPEERNGQVHSMVMRPNNVYGAYAETDLDNPDQPTNFSLRYAEGEEEEEEYTSKSGENGYYRGASIHDDSVKTYCTEGTPYQTPLNFSTATSMSDLREVSASKEEEEEEGDKSAEPLSRDEKVRDEEESEVPSKSSVAPSEISSGVMSPEKPTRYCVEGTPLCFSRVSSLSSLHSTEAANAEPMAPPSPPPKPQAVAVPEPKPEKAVTFGADETPLMFSRCSSLGSLSSFEQHSIHDDRSSIVSDFSRLTSGMISPSDLPDSPTQTEPPSPRQVKPPESFPSPRPPVVRPQPAPRNRVQQNSSNSFGEDEVRSYSDENAQASGYASGTSQSDEKQDLEREKKDELATVSEEEENDEDEGLLDACINSGMQNTTNRLRASPRAAARCTRGRSSGIPTRIPRRLNTPPRPVWNDVCEDTLKTFCTEDTPANISHAGSNSDLSILSHRDSGEGDGESPAGERHRTASTREESDDSSFSGDNEYILAECIQSGMPKAKERSMPPAQVGGVKKKVSPRKTGHLCSLNHSHAPSPRTSYHPRTLLNRVQPTLEKTRMPPTGARDEVKTYAIEGTPVMISNATSLSDLTVNSDSPSPHRPQMSQRQPSDGQSYSPTVYATEDTPMQFSHASSLSSLHMEDEGAACIQDTFRSRLPVLVDRGDQFHSDGGSWEQDERRQKTASSASEEVVTVLSRTGSLSSLSVESLGAEPSPSEQALLDQCISLGMPKSKSDLGCASKRKNRRIPAALQYEDERERSHSLEKHDRPLYHLTARSCSQEESRGSLPEEPKNESVSATAAAVSCVAAAVVENENIDIKEAESIPEPNNLDQNANVETSSPEKAAVSPPSDNSPVGMASSGSSAGKKLAQPSAIMKMSDTWNEDSPNSISFPSLSGSAPMASSQDEDKVIISRSMEGLLELEAERVAMAMAEEASSDSMLEFVKPPPMLLSSIHSISTSLSGPEAEGGYRSRNVPAVVLRALNGGSAELYNGGGDLMLSGSSSCTSHLENQKPPPAFDEIDMENSMISVASITSEVAGEHQHRAGSSGESDHIFDMLRPAAVMAEMYVRQCQGGSLSENLDSINPPSTFNEITDLTEPESTIEPGTETIGSDTELEPEELPADGSKTGTPLHSNDSTPKRRRKLTPKQRRNLVKDRYATYTIATEEENKRPDSLPLNDVKQSQNESSKTPKQRRFEDKDRFLTQTINPVESPLEMAAAKEPEARAIRTAKQKRLEDKERYLTQTIESPVTQVSSPERTSELGEEEMAALQREANVVMNALQDPASESCTELLECETLSLISNDKESSEEENAAGPKIVKPSENEPEGSPKGIRGRRKALYTSPAARSRGAKSTTPSPAGARSTSMTPAVRPTRASALRQRGASPRSQNRASSIPSTSSSPGGSPKNKANKKPPLKPLTSAAKGAPKPPNNSPENVDKPAEPPKLVKQGTFTKDSTIDPAVKSATRSRLPVRSPSADTITSAPAFRTQRSLEGESRTRIASRLRRDTVQPISKPQASKPPARSGIAKPGTSRSPLSMRRGVPGIKTSLSNHSLQSPDGSAASKAKTSSTPSLNNTGTGAKKKEVTSKIASLWKKVEDSRNKQKYQKPDTRVWITSNGSTDPPPLVRSSTFEKEENPKPNNLAATLAKLKRQCEESTGLPKSDKNGKPQASAVVPPFNYSPPPNLVNGNQHVPKQAGQEAAESDPSTASVRVTSV